MFFKEEDIRKAMKNLDLTREEAIQMLQDDADDVTVELTPEQKKVVKEMTRSDREKEKAPRKRERKVNPNKRTLINALVDSLNVLSTVEVLNPERELELTYCGEKYKVTLTKTREKKEN